MARRAISKRGVPSKGAGSPKVVGQVGGLVMPAVGPVGSGEPTKVEVLLGEILQLEAAANSDAVMARAEVGKMLLEVKGELAHGQWELWLSDNAPFEVSTAKRAIQLFHLSQGDPEAFEALRPLGLTKAYKLMAMGPEERDAFLGKAHPVPGGAVKTPQAMTFEQMMAVLHPPKPETTVTVTTKLVKSIRRQTLGLGKLLSQLWKMVPTLSRRQPVKEALSVLAFELDAVADQLEDKSLIEGSIPSFG